MHRVNAIPRLIIIFALLVLVGSFSSAVHAFDPKTDDQNMVRVDVKPVQLEGGRAAVFEVRLNTHSVDLSYDMVKASILQDDQGKVYKAANWKGSSPGGHHRRGTLEFPQLEGTPKSVRLIIRGIADVPERSFEWKIEG